MGMKILRNIRESAGLTRHEVGGAEFSTDVVQQYERDATECLPIHYLVRLRQATGWTWERFGAELDEGLAEGRPKRQKQKKDEK